MQQQPKTAGAPGNEASRTRADKHAASLRSGDSDGRKRLYGAVRDYRRWEERAEEDRLSRRRVVSCRPALLAVLIPWLAFVVSFAVAASYLHYAAPVSIASIVLAAVLAILFYATRSMNALRTGEDWFGAAYMALAIALFTVAGLLCGDWTFWYTTLPLFEVENMAVYNNVKPSAASTWPHHGGSHGKNFQDAGSVYFVGDAVVDRNRSMSFKMGSVYCVAPIVAADCLSKHTAAACASDFWAVGVDCCSEADFRCGEWDNPHAKAGLRSMDEEARPYFRLAVVQAEGAYKVSSPHPVFLHWLQDPVAEMHTQRRRGYRHAVVAMLASFVASGVLLVTVACRFGDLQGGKGRKGASSSPGKQKLIEDGLGL